MKKNFVYGIIVSTFMIASLAGCNESNGTVIPDVKKYDIVTASDTLDFECATNAFQGKDLTFKVSLKQTAIDKGYMLPNSSTTEIKVGNFTLGEANYVYNLDMENNKGLYLIPGAFINGDITLNIEGFTLTTVPLKLENGNTPLKLSDDEQPMMGINYTNSLRIDVPDEQLNRYGLPEDIVIKCKEEGEEDSLELVKGQYTYDKNTGYFFIPGDSVGGELTIYAQAVDYDAIHVNIAVIGDGSISYEINNKNYVRLNQPDCSFKITPSERCYELESNPPLRVLVNGKLANYNYTPYNEWEATLGINQVIDGDIAIFMTAKRKKAVKLYPVSGIKESVIATVNPDLYLNTAVCAYLAPIDPVNYKLPNTLESVEVFDFDNKLVKLQPSDYYYNSNTGLFMVTNKDLVTDRIQICVDAVALN